MKLISMYGVSRTASECARRLCIATYNAGIRLSRSLQGTAPGAAESVCDILNAGPRHRFTTASSIAHNCGYGAGPEKVQIIAKTMVGIDLTLDETRILVAKFRSRKFIPSLWSKLEMAMGFEKGHDFTMGLHSGREMIYRDVMFHGKLSAVIPRNGKMMRLTFWGGTLTENLVQATARDVFMDRVLALNAAGMPPILRVHDEAVCLLKEETAEADLARMISIFATKPEWMPELPLSADGHLCKRYHKG